MWTYKPIYTGRPIKSFYILVNLYLHSCMVREGLNAFPGRQHMPNHSSILIYKMEKWMAAQRTFIARYTLFANNTEIGSKRRKNNVRQIVYKRRSPCFTNRFFTLHCTQDLHRGSSLIDEHKVFFHLKKIICCAKIDGEQ